MISSPEEASQKIPLGVAKRNRQVDIMVRYWAMAPTMHTNTRSEGATFDERWEYDLANGVISIGWDMHETPQSKAHLEWLWDDRANPYWGDREVALRMLGYFWFDVQPGDIVIARAGVEQYVGYGVFRGEPWYDERGYGQTGIKNYYSFRRVVWAPPSGERKDSPVRFGRNTLYPLTDEKVALLQNLPFFPSPTL